MVMIREITETKDLGFDLVDDTSVYMRNDPEFYRKQYFPAMASMADMHSAGKPVDSHKCLSKLVDQGCTSYCQKYNLARHPDEVYSQQDRDALIDKIFSEEMELIKQGEYK